MAVGKTELRRISYAEFGIILNKLTRKLKKSGIKFDLVVPILRSGAVTGVHLASKLGVTNLLPAQYKYIYEPERKMVKKFNFPKLRYPVPDKAKILVTDTNVISGSQAQRVIFDVRKKYPQAKIYFASASVDRSLRPLKEVEEIFYGMKSNENECLNGENKKKRGRCILVLPWESMADRWQEIRST